MKPAAGIRRLLRHTAGALILAMCAASLAANEPDLLSRIRTHMREYLAQLPDYTCRVTIERSIRRNRRSGFALADRLRLDIAYSSGSEFYAWPGSATFENGIEDLLPERGLVSNGSYALHARKLFLTNDAQFASPRYADCDGAPCVQADFIVPAVRSGYSLSASGASAPAELRGSVWFAPDTLDLLRLEVRVESTPKSVRIAATREVTTYAPERIGGASLVLPATSELTLRDRDGSERRNLSKFADYHRFTGSATIRYGTGTAGAASSDATALAASSTPVPSGGRVRSGARITAVLEQGLPADSAVGDEFHASGGVTGRITDMRRAGDRWSLQLTLLQVGADRASGSVRRTVALPAPPGMTVSWQAE